MKLPLIRPEMFARAVALYCEIALPGKPKDPAPDFSRCRSTEEAVALFQDECGRDAEKKLHRYTLRLGNSRYPFMKLVLQEVLIEGEYFFGVDSHDEMEVRPSFPDYAAWLELKAFNARLKGEIEARLEQEGLPTTAGLQGLACELIPSNLKQAAQRRILVVDDDRNIREAISALLAAKGHLVETASEGEEALAKVGWTKPDLVVLDYEMPGLDGLATIERLRAEKETRNLPVLLATAGKVDLNQVKLANGFLVKPFQTQVFYSLVEHLLGARDGGARLRRRLDVVRPLRETLGRAWRAIFP